MGRYHVEACEVGGWLVVQTDTGHAIAWDAGEAEARGYADRLNAADARTREQPQHLLLPVAPDGP